MTAHERHTTPDAHTEKASVPPAGALRCSDDERERTSSALRVAAGEGRLSLHEVDERLEKTYAARFRHELDEITVDLPSPAPAATGWRLILTMARLQFADDMSALTGRAQNGINQRRRLGLALSMLAMVLLLVAMLMLTLHGVDGDGPENHDFGRG